MTFAYSARRNIVSLLLCITLGSFTTNALSTTVQTEAKAELTVIEKMIRAVSSRLGYARSERDIAEKKLRTTEIAIGRLAKESREIEFERRKQQKQLKELRRQRNRKTKELAMQRRDLARQILFSYAMGRQDYLKIFLNQEDPSKMARVLTYYRYFNRARAEQINETRLRLDRLGILEQEIDRKTLLLDELKRTKEQAGRNLKKLFERRKAVVAKIEGEISRDDRQLARLEQNKNRIEGLITNIRRESKPFENKKPFRNLRGRLEWPTVGLLLNDFGAKRDVGGLRWQGVRIAANTGQPVRAISHGRVVFADWLRGFGLLLIIDHGNGYMSLYGQNQSLYKQPGEQVETGEVIAGVGNSGAQGADGLYFEIRHQGRPRNPALWCR
uniref:Septal ring factor EnvC, activator of murein hydrolases AmiA and AmiB n=1 Tax=Candidatus Kentrum sp. FM TaxID=2126340 RepID=A0A450SIA5_9GAMM|nr:MAG: Septal ring factor EnvC, activator of murein hydrolases AmiA and AmiB [Candidatus Kentron sp. FM]VFJ56346.1 MAG: Septal ring factor EnvC, activator of murein hydrolases AmiA and AmiB [Candidatus Kentron sp. FM]VFK11180.1 MAG: Septal ring factor EnvC, activator of murein hydrolases AmiA and AmiB [Candidatus Kentron sp. FM]